jgi:RNA polymerase sigma factor (sigma-70 family)
MAHATLRGVLGHLRNLCDTQAADAELLACFARNQDEASFAALLRRHGPMVWGVARRLLGDLHDAEDVFQATFLILARKAAALRKGAAVASFLHGVARRLALKTRLQKARRQAREKRAVQMRDTKCLGRTDLDEVRAALDAALDELPEKYRAALVLCYLEGHSQEEAARRLGCPLATLRTHVARGRKLLRDRLAAQGITLSAAGLACLGLTAGAVAAPAVLVEATLRAALPFAAGQAAAALCSARVGHLVTGGLRAMVVTKVKTAMCVLVLGLLAGAVALASGQARQEPAGTPPPAAPAPKAVKTTRIVTRAVLLDGAVRKHLIIAIDPDSGAWTKLTDEGMDPRVSPDRQTVVFCGDGAVFNCDTGGANNPGKLFDWADGYGGPVWSPDGKYLYASRIQSQLGNHIWQHETWRRDADGRNPVRIPLPAGDAVLDVSPDGRSFLTRWRWLPRVNASELRIVKTDGTPPRVLSQPGGFNEHARFSPDGKAVAWCRNDAEGMSVWVVAADGTGRKKVFGEQGTHVEACCFSPDGKRLAVIACAYLPGPRGRLNRIPYGQKDGNWRIELMDADGKGGRPVPLADTALWLQGLDWYRPPQ